LLQQRQVVDTPRFTNEVQHRLVPRAAHPARGHVAQVQAIQNAVNEADLPSYGIDLHASLNRYVDLTFDINWQLRDAPGTDKRSAFADIAIVVGF
jgi:hypothetical protein